MIRQKESEIVIWPNRLVYEKHVRPNVISERTNLFVEVVPKQRASDSRRKSYHFAWQDRRSLFGPH